MAAPLPPARPAARTPNDQDAVDSLAAVGASLAARAYARRGVAATEGVIRVLIADDHTLFRAGLRLLLRGVADIDVVGEAADGEEAVALAERLTPDVVVMDLDMPGLDGEGATRALAEAGSTARVLVLTMHAEEDRLVALLEGGASGYLTKEAAERDLLEAIRVVASGDVYVRPRVARMLAAHQREAPRAPEARYRAAFDGLSDRERSVVQLTAQGYGGAEIGRLLGISNKTVETYKQRIEEKLGLRHRTQYVRLALAIGLLRR